MNKEYLAKRMPDGFTIAAAMLVLVALVAQFAVAQDPEAQQKLAAVKEAAAKNKQALAQYAWTERQTISLKGEVKKQTTYEVRLGPDGQPQKTEVAAMPQSSGGGREGRVKEHVKEKKKQEFEEYGQQLAALAHQYAQPDPTRLQEAFQQGNVTVGSAGAAGELQMVIKNYIKPNDKVTLMFNQQTKAIKSVQVASYLKDPKDAVEISAQFAQLPDGTNHVANMMVNGTSKKLTVATQNSNYQKL
ncbi:MAG TPA: hypothetical protein VKE93_02775 [Candidatus Angelobacter sp.]|nr:hypothetical protein [Candidatus Angelobacter sp.]